MSGDRTVDLLCKNIINYPDVNNLLWKKTTRKVDGQMVKKTIFILIAFQLLSCTFDESINDYIVNVCHSEHDNTLMSFQDNRYWDAIPTII